MEHNESERPPLDQAPGGVTRPAQESDADAHGAGPNGAGGRDLEAALSEATARAEDFRQRFLYAVADLDNAKKRMQRSVDDAERAFKKRLLLKLLPVLG